MNDELKYTADDLRKMTVGEAKVVLAKACRIEGTAVVRRADGSVRYDDVTLAGTYHEDKGDGPESDIG